MNKQLVVIKCLAYNQESYIRQCLDGFIIQKTNFPFVAIVHDDASTDHTSDIIREYEQKYPKIIKPIYETENQHSKRNGSLALIMKNAADRYSPKYFAVCEGDDYWTDSNKLQTQVDFMESHPDFTMCFHRVDTKYESGMFGNDIFSHVKTQEYIMGKSFLCRWTVPTCSILYRSNIDDCKPKDKNFQYGDSLLCMTCFSKGRVYAFGESMGVYRKNAGSWNGTRTTNQVNIANFIQYKTLIKNFPSLDLSYLQYSCKKLAFAIYNDNNYDESNRILKDIKAIVNKYRLQYFSFSLRKRMKSIIKKIIYGK